MKLLSTIQKHETLKKLITVLLMNAAVLVALLLMFTPAENEIDYTIKSFLCGAFGYGKSAHFPYINFLLGAFLKLLQSFIPAISWYEAVSYIVLFAAFTSFSFVVFDYKHLKRTFLILFPIYVFWGYEGYIKLTYFKTAGIIAACGIFVFLAGLSGKKHNKAFLIVGSFLSIAGCLFCHQSLYIVFPVMAGVLLIKMLINVREHNQDILHNTLCHIMPTVILAAVLVAITVFGSLLFSRNIEWQEYQSNQKTYDAITSGKLSDYADNIDAYQEIGIFENDIRLLTNGLLFADTEVFDPEMLSNIKEVEEENYSVRAFFRLFPVSLITQFVFYGAILLFLLLCFSKQKMYKWLMICYPLIAVMCIEYILYIRGSFSVHHLNVVLWFAVSLFIVSFIYKHEFDNRLYPVVAVASVAVLIFTINRQYNYIVSKTYNGSGTAFNADESKLITDRLTSYEDALFVFSKDEYAKNLKAYDVFESIPEGYLNNCFFLPSYIYPSQRVAALKFGYDNIYAYLCNENVYYVSFNNEGNASIIRRYMKEHYNENADYIKVGSEGNLNIYKFYDKSQFAAKEAMLISWRKLEENAAEPLNLMELVEKEGELHSASIITDADTGIASLFCCGRIDRESLSEIEISSYLYDNDYIGCKISVDDITPYHYLYFTGQKLQDHGQPGVYIYDPEGTCVYGNQKYYYDIDNEWNSYIYNVSKLTGPVDIILNGGYIDLTGSLDSQFIFSDITLY